MQLRRSEQDFVVRTPADDLRAAAQPSEPLRQTAADRHDVNLRRSFIGADKRDALAIRRDGRVGLLGRMRGEALGNAAIDADLPEVALGGKDQRIAGNRRGAEVAGRSRDVQRDCDQCCEEDRAND